MHNPSLSILTENSFPEVAAAIRSRATHVLERLRGSVKQVIPAADELTLNEVMDHLPREIEDMAASMVAKGARQANVFFRDAGEHGVCRYHQSFNLSELLVEHSILRSILVEEVATTLERPLDPAEILALNACLDTGTRRAVESFVAYQSRELQSASEGQSKYLSFLSHDLRGNLNGILLMVEVLRRELTASRQFEDSLEDLDLMRRSILETVSTMDRFLYAERFRKGKVEVRLGTVDLKALLPETISQVAQQAKAKGLAIETDMSACQQVTSDRELISIILQNLLSNAVKYSDEGTIDVIAQLTSAGEPRISVKDQGAGIPEQKLKEIFDPFTRGDTHGQKGVGLGLTIAKQAADLLGARLWAESTPGDGSTFFLQLPKSAALAAT